MAGKARIPWVLRWAAFAMLATAFFFTAPAREGRTVWILLDVSGSVRRLYAKELEDLHSIVEPCLRTLGPGDRVGLIAFGADSIAPLPLVSRSAFERQLPRSLGGLQALPEERESNFESAYWAARNKSPAAVPLELWVWTDGLETAGSLAKLEISSVNDSRWFSLPFPEGFRWDAQIRSLEAPRELPLGSEAIAAVEVWADSHRKTSGKLLMEVGPSNSPELRKEIPVDLDRGEKRIFSLPISLSRSGEFALSLDLEIEGMDPIDPNNHRTAHLRSGGNRTFLCLGDTASISKAFRKTGKIFLNSIWEPGERHGWQSETFHLMDGLWVQDPPERRFDDRDDANLLRFVRAGAACVFWMGPEPYDFFFRETPALKDCLPWSPSPDESAPEDVLLLLDRSGSMAGGKFEIAANAAYALVHALPPSAELRVASFAEAVGDFQIWRGRGESSPRPITVSPGIEGCRGGTNLEETLRHSAASFALPDARMKRRILLLSDGRQTAPGPSMDGFRSVAKELQDRAISVVALGVGEDPDFESLRAVTSQEKNGRVIPVKSLDALGEVFEKEGSSAYFEPGAHELRLASSSPFPGLPPRAPSISSLMKVKLRPDSQVIYETTSGKPVLAMRREGLGVVIALAADPRLERNSGWSQDPAIWESILLSIPRRLDVGELTLDENGANFFPGETKPQSPEIFLEHGKASAARFWKQGDFYRSEAISALEPPEKPIQLHEWDGRDLPLPDMVEMATNFSNGLEWRGGGRSILRYLQDPPTESRSQSVPFSRQSMLLASLAALLLSWLLPFVSHFKDSRNRSVSSDRISQAHDRHENKE